MIYNIPPSDLPNQAIVQQVDTQRHIELLALYGIMPADGNFKIGLEAPKGIGRINLLGEMATDGAAVELILGGGWGPTFTLENVFVGTDLSLISAAASPERGYAKYGFGAQAGLEVRGQNADTSFGLEASARYLKGGFDFDGRFHDASYGETLRLSLDGRASFAPFMVTISGELTAKPHLEEGSGLIEIGGLVDVYEGILVGGKLVQRVDSPAELRIVAGWQNEGVTLRAEAGSGLEDMVISLEGYLPF